MPDHAPDGRFGIYTGVVAETNDPQQRGRVRLRVPSLFSQEVLPNWALAVGQTFGAPSGSPSGSMVVPEVGAVVFVMFLDGDASLPVYLPGPWAATPAEVASSTQHPPVQNGYPKRRLWWRSHRGRGFSVVEKESGDVSLATARTTLRVQNEGGRIELDVRGGPDGKIVVNGGDGTKKAARYRDPVRVGTLSFTFTPGAAAALSITYLPPDGGAPVTLASGTGTIELSGLIDGGSASVLVGD